MNNSHGTLFVRAIKALPPSYQRVLESCRVTLSVFKALQILIIRRYDIIYMSFHWSP